MQVVGVDFGTTNVRIATWDSSQPDRTGRGIDHAGGDCLSETTWRRGYDLRGRGCGRIGEGSRYGGGGQHQAVGLGW